MDAAGEYVNNLTTNTAGVNVTYNDAGQAAMSGVKQFRTRYDNAVKTLENHFGQQVPKNTIAPAPMYQKALNDLTNVASGFPATQKTVQNSFVRELADNFKNDAPNGEMSVEALRQTRTRIGMELDQASLKPDVDTGALKSLYAGLTRDLEGIAAQAGPRAKMAWDRAQRAEKMGAQRLQNYLDPLVKNRTVEQVQSSLARLDGTRAKELMASLRPDQRRIVAASLMEDMGMAKPSQQTAGGNAALGNDNQFSFETFLTNYKTMQQKGMADAVFNHPSTAGMKQGLDALVTASGRARESARFLSNPSGSARAGMAQAAMFGLVTSPLTGMSNAIPMAVGAYVAPNLAARLFRNPDVVQWLGKATQMQPAELPGHLARLAVVARQNPELADPIRQYIDALKAQIPQAKPSDQQAK